MARVEIDMFFLGVRVVVVAVEGLEMRDE